MSLLPSFAEAAANAAGIPQNTPAPAAPEPEKPAAASQTVTARADSANENLFLINEKTTPALLRAALSGFHEGINLPGGLFSQFSEAAKSDKKDKEARDFLIRLTAQQMQEKIRRELDDMRRDLVKEIDRRLEDMQRQIEKTRQDKERLVRVTDQIAEQGLWSLEKDDARFFKNTVGEETYRKVEKLDEKREAAEYAYRQNPTPETKAQLEDAKANIHQAVAPHIEEKQKQEMSIRQKIDRLTELKKELDQGTSFEVKDGKFVDPLMQKAAEAAGIDPATYDPDNPEQGDALFDKLVEKISEARKELEITNSIGAIDHKAIVTIETTFTVPTQTGR